MDDRSQKLIEQLKLRAKVMKKVLKLKQHEALNRVAVENGYESWERLMNSAKQYGLEAQAPNLNRKSMREL